MGCALLTNNPFLQVYLALHYLTFQVVHCLQSTRLSCLDSVLYSFHVNVYTLYILMVLDVWDHYFGPVVK